MEPRKTAVVVDPAVLERMEQVFALYDLALDMMRQNLRREHPEDAPERIEGRLAQWLIDRPWSFPPAARSGEPR